MYVSYGAGHTCTSHACRALRSVSRAGTPCNVLGMTTFASMQNRATHLRKIINV